MDKWLKGLIAAACIVVIFGGGYFAYGEYIRFETARSGQIFREQRKLEAEKAEREAAQRVAEIARESRDKELLPELKRTSCEQEVIDLLYIADMKPIKTSADVPNSLAQRLDVCLRHNLIAPKSLDEIKAKGLATIFDNVLPQ